jgi:hypothetical protein
MTPKTALQNVAWRISGMPSELAVALVMSWADARVPQFRKLQTRATGGQRLAAASGTSESNTWRLRTQPQ